MITLRSSIALAGALLAACVRPAADRAGGAPRVAPGDACILPTGDVTARARSITIGLVEPVDPLHAPLPRNDAERLVFRHLYETPVRLDCERRVLPGLAEEWVRDDGGRRWTFRLRQSAQFWDGAPVTAQDVVFGKGGVGYTLGVLDRGVVTVALARPQEDVPSVLADPALAVTKPAPDGSWPIGTGSYWATSGTTTEQEIRAQGSRGDTLVFRFAPAGGNARDLLDAGVDLLVTRDRALRDYAATLPNVTVAALPWDLTHVFVTAEAGGGRFDGLEQAVRAEARRAEGGFWWLDLRACGPPATVAPPRPAGSQRRILYLRSDVTARELAGRLAALSRGVAVARTQQEFDAALEAARDWGYIVALPRVVADPCRAAQQRLPQWAATVTALVDTRATAIVRRGVARWGVDLNGTVHIAP